MNILRRYNPYINLNNKMIFDAIENNYEYAL